MTKMIIREISLKFLKIWTSSGLNLEEYLNENCDF